MAIEQVSVVKKLVAVFGADGVERRYLTVEEGAQENGVWIGAPVVRDVEPTEQQLADAVGIALASEVAAHATTAAKLEAARLAFAQAEAALRQFIESSRAALVPIVGDGTP